MLDESQANDLSIRLKALSDPVRLRLVSVLACAPGGEMSACDLPLIMGRKQPTISHHLKLLATAGIIRREQRGKWAWFSLVPGSLDDIRTALGGGSRPSADGTGPTPPDKIPAGPGPKRQLDDHRV